MPDSLATLTAYLERSLAEAMKGTIGMPTREAALAQVEAFLADIPNRPISSLWDKDRIVDWPGLGLVKVGDPVINDDARSMTIPLTPVEVTYTVTIDVSKPKDEP